MPEKKSRKAIMGEIMNEAIREIDTRIAAGLPATEDQERGERVARGLPANPATKTGDDMASGRHANTFTPRPRLISPADFAELADLAWRADPRRGLAKQISMAIGVAESTIDRWLKDDGYPPPPEVVRQALELADKRMEAKADLLDRITRSLT